MIPYRHLLVATDFSAPALEAVRSAAHLAESFDARITLIHVFRGVPFGNMAPLRVSVAAERQLEMELARDATEKLNALRDAELQNVRSELLAVAHPSPALALCDLAAARKADLCVVGTHGRGAVAHALLGSVAERVIRHAPCDVLVARTGLSAEGPVVTATDLSPDSLLAVERGRALARRLHRTLDLLYVYDDSVPVAADEGIHFLPVAEVKVRMEEHLNDLRQTYFGDASDVKSHVVVDRHPARALSGFARDRDASLLVLGTHGRTGTRRMLIGSVAEHTARVAPCSVLVVRSG